MRFDEFSTPKPRSPKKPRKPLTPDQAVISAHKKQIGLEKQAMKNVRDHQKERKEAERTRNASYIAALKTPRSK